MTRQASQFEKMFLKSNQGLIDLLSHPEERERHWALAQLEATVLGRGFPDALFEKVLKMALNDSSPLVRGQAQRFLYHEPSECWPIDEEQQRQLEIALFLEPVGRGMGGFDGILRFEMQEIEKRIHWLRE
jgi:hypothetical protein